jgi:DNA phosphorothioation-dependent restriction protein DptF
VTPIRKLLSQLLSSSRNGIVNGQIGELSELQRFLHVERPPEIRLCDLVASATPGTAKLILLCGNVGDGKSHLISHLKQIGRLGDFDTHNDATESFDPSKTNLETLEEKVLTDFSDDRLGTSSKHLILAINLGVLANFYDEANTSKYSRLRKYIHESRLLERTPSNAPPPAHFAHVDFTSSPLLDFNGGTVSAPLFRELLDRIFAKVVTNPFYDAYSQSSPDDVSAVNFAFLLNQTCRRAFESLLIQAVVKHKVVFSVREFLDFLADCLIGRGGVMTGTFYEQVSDFLPYALFESSDSPLRDAFSTSDPVQIRSARADEAMFEIAAVNSQEKRLNIAFNYDTPAWLRVPVEGDDAIDLRMLCKLQQRLDFFNSDANRESEDLPYSDFLRLLCSVSNFVKGSPADSVLKEFIEMVSKAASCWHGNPHKAKHVVLQPPGPKNKYRLLRQFELRVDGAGKDVIELTNHDFSVRFLINGSSAKRVLHVDYELYGMLYKVSRGYLPNRYDQLACVALSVFVESIIATGLDCADIFVDQINHGGEIEFSATQSGFGLQFSRMH